MLEVETIMGSIKNQQNPLIFRKQQLNSLLSQHLPFRQKLTYNIYIENRDPDDQINQIPPSLESLYSYSKFQLSNPTLSNSHIIAIMFLSKLQKHQYINFQQSLEICNKIIHIIVDFKSEEEYFDLQHQFLLQSLQWINNVIVQQRMIIENQIINSLMRRDNIIERQLKKVLEKRLENQDKLLSKIFFFIKVNGLNSNTSLIFQQVTKIIQMTNNRLQMIAQSLNTKVVITLRQTQMLELYQGLNKLNNENNEGKLQELLNQIISKMLQVVDEEGYSCPQFFKIQRIIQQCQIQNRLFRLIQMFNNREILRTIFQLLSLCAKNSYWSCKSILNQFQKLKVLSLHSYDWGQYNVIAKITESQLFIEPQHYDFIDSIITNKKYLPESDNTYFAQTLLLLSEQHINKLRVIRLIQGSTTLRLLLNVPPDKKFISSDIQYCTNCIKFLNNLNHTEYSKQLSESIAQLFNLPELLLLIKNHGFYLDPSRYTHGEFVLQAQIFKLIYEYNLYQNLKQQSLTKMLTESLQTQLKMLRLYTNQNHENILFFLESQKLDANTNDIIYYCSQFLYILLILSVRQMNDVIIGEGNKLSIRKVTMLVAAEITTIIENYLSEKQYNSRKGSVNKLLKLLEKQFNMELELKYYYNYNNQTKQEVKQRQEDTIFKKQKMYMKKYEINRIVLQFSLSQQFKQMLKLQQQQSLQRLQTLIYKGESNFINHIIFVLEKNDLNNSHLRMCRILLQMLDIKETNFTNLFMEARFVDTFYSLLRKGSPHLKQLLLISHKLIQGDSKQVNKQVQLHFEKGIEQDVNQQIIDVMKKHISRILEVEQTKQPVIKEVEKYIKYQIKNPQTCEFSVGMMMLILIQYICQSLNLSVKSKFGSCKDKSDSILIILIRLTKLLTEDCSLMSRFKATILIQCLKTISSLIRGPHQKNIQRVLYQGYHKILLSILLVEDDFNIILEKLNRIQEKEQIVSKGYLNFLNEGNQNFCRNLLKPQILLRQPLFDIKQISELKRLVLSQTIIIMDFFNKNTLKMFYDVCRKSLIEFMQKAYKIYGYQQADLEKLIISKNIDNTFDKILAFDIQDLIFDKPEADKSHQLIKDSLHLETGINLFIVMSKYEEKQKLEPIKQSINKYLSSQRLRRRYNQKAGIFYQLYILFKDIIMGIIGIFMRLCRAGQFAYSNYDHMLETDQDKYKKSIDFFAKNIASIEVRIEGKDTLISFPLLLEQRCITKSIKRDLNRSIDYSTTTEGQRTFMNRMNIILLRIKQQRKLSKLMIRNKLLGVIIKNRELWKNLSFFTAVLQNVVLLAKARISDEFYISAAYLLRAIQYSLAILLFILFIFESFSIRKILAEKQFDEKGETNKFKRWMKVTWFILTDKTLLFVLYYVLFTSLGIKWDVAVSLLLIDFFYRFKATRFLQSMVVHVWPSLLTNITFFFIILYLVILILGNQRTQQFFGMTCQTYASCMQMAFFSIEKIQPPNDNDTQKSFSLGGIGVITTSLTIFVILACRGLFFGIMIDQKRKVRKQKEELRKLIVDKCFICGETRANINRQEGMEKGFKKHIELYHNIWNYVYYLSYVSELPAEEITIQQYIILNQLKNKSYAWIPTKHY